jgi:putative ABC transport system permease protein
MLAGAGAAIEGFLQVAHRPLGYDPHNVMSVGIPIHDGTYKSWTERAAYFEKLSAAPSTLPGVTMTAISSNATPPSSGRQVKFEIVGKPSSEDQSLRFNLVSQNYFPILSIPLVQGRTWDDAETQRGATVVVVNETLARRYFPSGDAVGHTIRLPELKEQPPFFFCAPGYEKGFLIVGVVGDKLNDGLTKPVLPEAFAPFTDAMGMYTQILVRSQIPPLTLLHAVQLKVNAVDHDQQTSSDVRDLEHWITRTPEWARGQLVAWLFGGFAGLALVLAAVGLYSVVSYTVVQRTNEFGIRIALGAQRTHVLSMVFRSMLISVGSGIFAGLGLTLALNKVLASWAAESSRDPLLLLAASFVLAMTAALASMLPAQRAAGLDPMKAIRYE